MTVSGLGSSAGIGTAYLGGSSAVASTTPASGSNSAASTGSTSTSASQDPALQKLVKRDAEVKAHERAHQAAAGGLAGAASFTYQKGSDGKNYAIGGEVSIDSSAVRSNPKATIDKMATVIRAATAPSQPSSQDLKVAAQAQQEQSQASAELQRQRTQGSSDPSSTAGDNSASGTNNEPVSTNQSADRNRTAPADGSDHDAGTATSAVAASTTGSATSALLSRALSAYASTAAILARPASSGLTV